MKNDYRIRITKKLIRDSFLMLLKTKSLEKITIKEICCNANINRSTFYTHYTDIYNLHDEILDTLYTALISSIKNLTDLNLDFKFIVEICNVFYKNKDLCEIILGDHGSKLFIEKSIKLGHDYSIKYWKSIYPNNTEDQYEKTYLFLSGGSFSIIRAWIQTGMKESPENIAFFIEKLCLSGLSTLK